MEVVDADEGSNAEKEGPKKRGARQARRFKERIL